MSDVPIKPKAKVLGLLERAFRASQQQGHFKTVELPRLSLQEPPEQEHGDLATNLALVLAGQEKASPKKIAEILLQNLPEEKGLFSRVWVAGPGFINFQFSPDFWRDILFSLASCLPGIPISDLGKGNRVSVEFVSANPTGPLHVGHGRGAAVGDAISRLLAFTGHDVTRQYYINDAGRQVEALGRSILFRLQELLGEQAEPCSDYYPGEYVRDIASLLRQEIGGELDAKARLAAVQEAGIRCLMEEIKRDLTDFRVDFQEFLSERELVERGDVGRAIELLRARGVLYDAEGALWFQSSAFEDEKDRAVVKSDGSLTYLASDIALHHRKFSQGFDRLINIWGADHHGYVARLKGAMRALGHPDDRLTVVLVQMVNLTRDGVPVRMGKRSGEFVTLREVMEEVGTDAARFFFLMRKSDSHLDFDLELARKQSVENPVFYVQYAHSRIASILRLSMEKQIPQGSLSEIRLERLELEEELEMAKTVARFGETVEEAARDLEPHRIVFYLMELAGRFHRYYNHHKVLSDDLPVAQARMLLIRLVQAALATGLNLLGVSAPDRM
jgi:arginyl-tRNA synthetase